MKDYKVTGFRNGVWCVIVIRTIEECIPMRANQLGMTEVVHYEEI